MPEVSHVPEHNASVPDPAASAPDLVARIRILGKYYVLQIEGSNKILPPEILKTLRVPYEPLNPENPLTVGVYTYAPIEKSDKAAVTFLVSGMPESEALLEILRKQLNATIAYQGVARTQSQSR